MFGSIFTGSVLSGTSLGLGAFGECPAGMHDEGLFFEDCQPDPGDPNAQAQSGGVETFKQSPAYKDPNKAASGGSAPKPAPKPATAAPPPPASSGFSMASVTGNPLVLGGLLLVLGGGAIWYAKHRKQAA